MHERRLMKLMGATGRGTDPSPLATPLVIHSFIYIRLIEKVVRTQLNSRIQHKTNIR